MFAIIGIIGAIGTALNIYRTIQLQEALNNANRKISSLEENASSLASSSSVSEASISSICEKVFIFQNNLRRIPFN